MSEKMAQALMILFLCILFIVYYFLYKWSNKMAEKRLNKKGIYTIEQQMRWKKAAEEKDLQAAYFRSVKANVPQPEQHPSFEEWKAQHTKEEP